MNKLLWIDLEMTGLDVETEVIIEVGAIITDLQFNELDTYHAVVKQPSQYLENMDEWNQTHHTDSGLLALIPSGRHPNQVENDLIDLTEQHFSDEKAIIAGNSIGQDRAFINQHFRKFSEKLHYRMLDVTSFKLIFNTIYDKKFEKEINHRAVDDIRESIEELKYYLRFVKV